MNIQEIKKTAITKTEKNPDITTHGDFLFLLRNEVVALKKQVSQQQKEINFLHRYVDSHTSRIRILEEKITQLKKNNHYAKGDF